MILELRTKVHDPGGRPLTATSTTAIVFCRLDPGRLLGDDKVEWVWNTKLMMWRRVRN